MGDEQPVGDGELSRHVSQCREHAVADRPQPPSRQQTAEPSTIVALSMPLKLSRKVGDRNVPSSMLPTRTRRAATHAAVRHPKRMSTAMVTTLASPGLMPGRGLGNALSTMLMVIASAASQATRWSSRVVVICRGNRSGRRWEARIETRN